MTHGAACTAQGFVQAASGHQELRVLLMRLPVVGVQAGRVPEQAHRLIRIRRLSSSSPTRPFPSAHITCNLGTTHIRVPGPYKRFAQEKVRMRETHCPTGSGPDAADFEGWSYSSVIGKKKPERDGAF